MTLPVVAAPHFDPAMRIRMELPDGLTVAEILDRVLPDLGPTDRDLVRVVLSTERGARAVPSHLWHLVRPRPGVQVVIRVVPGKDGLRSLLTIVVAIAAVALGQLWAPALVGAFGGTTALWAGVVGLGVSAVGQLLINALIPPTTTSNSSETANVYTLDGFKNRLEPDGPVTDIVGSMRFAPRFAARPYTEIVGDIQYQRCLFHVGYGGGHGIEISDMRIGDTSIDAYDEIDIETREGLDSDNPVSLYASQVSEQQLGVELTRPLPRDDAGNIIAGASIETPVIRVTGRYASGCSLIFAFPQGLGAVDGSGNKSAMTVRIRIRQRPAGTTAWTEVTTLALAAAKLEAVYRQYTWSFEERGRYEIEVTRVTDETTSTRVQSRSYWAALQTLRPEYPINFPFATAAVALRIRATYQLNGSLDDFNLFGAKRVLDWEHTSGSWVVRPSSNPAAIFRYLLQSPANPRPQANAAIDLDWLAHWHDMCRLKGLKYDRQIDEVRPLREWLAEVAAAGRATPRYDGQRWTVVIDEPQTLVIDHVNPRNSWGFKCRRSYFEPPHGFRVSFLDATNDYKPAERIVPWPGRVGAITLTEQLQLPGKTDPDEIWIEARRRMYEAIHRPDVFEVTQAGAARVATRGDLVALSHDVLDRVQIAARVKSVAGRLVELDEVVTMVAGESYAIRYRAGLTTADTVGISLVVPVAAVAGAPQAVVMSIDPTEPPAVGDLIHFGRRATIDTRAIVTREEAGQGMSALLRLVDEGAVIHALTDAEVPPAWSGLAGDELGTDDTPPEVPVFTGTASGAGGTGTSGRLVVSIAAAGGTVVVAQFVVQHKLAAGVTWTTLTVAASHGGVTIDGYATGNSVQVRVAAISAAGAYSPFSSPITVTIAA